VFVYKGEAVPAIMLNHLYN